jgi:P27 family predicted phage terminase small subunit
MAETEANMRPPASIGTEGAEEWKRIVAAVRKTGRTLKPADRSLLLMYVRMWILNRKAYDVVAKKGAIMTYPNKVKGPSPHYKTFVETSKLLQSMLTALGCTPASRDFDEAAGEGDPGDLKI